MNRTAARAGFDVGGRVQLLETDLDAVDDKFDHVDTRFQENNKRLASIQRLLTGILCSLVVASVMLALNLAVHR